MRMRAWSGLFLIATTAATVVDAARAQGGEDHKRPEKGDVAPDIALVDATSAEALSLRAELAAAAPEVPLVLVFLHHDKDLCVRLVHELAKEIDALGEQRSRCAVLLVFSGDQRQGPTIEAAGPLRAPFRSCQDPDRSAYQAMGMIAFPTLYVIDRRTGLIESVRRGYKVSLAQEVGARLQFALGMMTAEEYARLDAPVEEVPAAVKQRTTILRQAQQLLRTGKPEAALPLFDQVLAEEPADPAARAGRAVAASRLDRPEAHELLTAVHREQPEDAAIGLALANWYLRRDRLDEAEPLIRAALLRDPAPAHFALGNLHERRGNWREAAVAYREAAALLLR